MNKNLNEIRKVLSELNLEDTTTILPSERNDTFLKSIESVKNIVRLEDINEYECKILREYGEYSEKRTKDNKAYTKSLKGALKDVDSMVMNIVISNSNPVSMDLISNLIRNDINMSFKYGAYLNTDLVMFILKKDKTMIIKNKFILNYVYLHEEVFSNLIKLDPWFYNIHGIYFNFDNQVSKDLKDVLVSKFDDFMLKGHHLIDNYLINEVIKNKDSLTSDIVKKISISDEDVMIKALDEFKTYSSLDSFQRVNDTYDFMDVLEVFSMFQYDKITEKVILRLIDHSDNIHEALPFINEKFYSDKVTNRIKSNLFKNM